MAKKVKTIDGFSPRKAPGANRALGAASSAKKPKKAVKKTTPAKNARRIAVEDFTRPIGALDLTSDQIERDIAKNAQKSGKKGKKAKKTKGKKPKWSKKRKIITGVVIFLVLLVAAGIGVYLWGQGLLNKISNGNFGVWDVLMAKDVELKKDANGRTNVLVLGTSGYEMSGSDHDGAQLTDSIMIISIDQETQDVAMLSLPRDLYVGNTCTATGKVNEIYWCNNQDEDDELGGAHAAMEEIGEILGLDFQYYAHMDWGALVQLVDALGGVTVTLDEDIADDWTNTFIDAGVPTTINGEEALGLARARHGTANGDFTRGNSQQKILMAIKDRAISEGLSLGQMMDILGVLGDNVRTDFNADEMKTIYNMLRDYPMENIRQVTLLDAENGIEYVTTSTMNEISYVVPTAGTRDYREIQKYLKRMLSSDGLQREGAEILVLNGTETMGVASTEEERLETKGFYVAEIDDAPAGACAQKYCVYDLSEGKTPVTVAKLQEFYGLEGLLPESELPISYYTAPPYDFIVIVGESSTGE